MVEKNYELWDRLYFRDYLIEKPQLAKEYMVLKMNESKKHKNDRVAYTRAKSDFILKITSEAKHFYKNA
jgi:GrpB-like predicted nucleotidyltransferase (UPF0157 family)